MTVPSACLLSFLPCFLPSPSLFIFTLPRCIFPGLRRPWTLWLLCLCFRQCLGALWELCELSVWEGERKGSSWWDAAPQQQQAPLETPSGLSAGDNPPFPGVMTTQQRSFLIRLALLGLLVGLAELTAGEDEDYYMQELLTRDLYNQVQIQETPVASIPAKKARKEKNQGTKRLFKKFYSVIYQCSLSQKY